MEIKLNLCTKEEFMKIAEEKNINPWYGRKYLRGFRYENEIWIIKDCIGDLALIGHEVGHILGRKHTNIPIIMNPYGPLRWIAL